MSRLRSSEELLRSKKRELLKIKGLNKVGNDVEGVLVGHLLSVKGVNNIGDSPDVSGYVGNGEKGLPVFV